MVIPTSSDLTSPPRLVGNGVSSALFLNKKIIIPKDKLNFMKKPIEKEQIVVMKTMDSIEHMRLKICVWQSDNGNQIQPRNADQEVESISYPIIGTELEFGWQEKVYPPR